MKPVLPGQPRGSWAAAEEQSAQRVNVWLRWTSSGWNRPQLTVEQREHARRSQLTSWIVLGLLVVVVALIPAGITDTPTLVSLFAAGVGVLIAAALNRSGFTTAAGSLLVLLIIGAVLGALVSAQGGLDTIYLPAYDLLAIAIVIGASILPRGAAFAIAAVNIAVIVLDFTLQPRTGDLARQYAAEGALSLIARPIALQVIIAAVSFLWVRGTDQAIRRADKAEEYAQLEHAFAEQRRQLELGVQQILETHVRVANGDYSARAAMNQDNALWQISASLNNLLGRLQKSGQAEHQLRRTEDEIRRLAAAIDDAQAGRRPIWPAQTGTAADILIDRMTGRGRQTAMQPAQAMMPGQMPGQMPPLMPPGPMANQMAQMPMPPMPMPGQMFGGYEGPNSGPLGPNIGPTTGQLGPGWVNSGPLSNPRRNEQGQGQQGQQGQQGAPENPWFLPPDNQGW